MSMIACYMEVDLSILEKLKALEPEELFEEIEELEEDMNVTDLDKMWDGLHCLLTKESASDPIEGNALSEAIVGVVKFDDDNDDFITYIEPVRVQEIAKALYEIDITSLSTTFDPEYFAEKDIYPNIWMRDDKDELAEELTFAFEELKQFYNGVSERNNAVVVSIY